jgi:hypothetical protein
MGYYRVVQEFSKRFIEGGPPGKNGGPGSGRPPNSARGNDKGRIANSLKIPKDILGTRPLVDQAKADFILNGNIINIKLNGKQGISKTWKTVLRGPDGEERTYAYKPEEHALGGGDKGSSMMRDALSYAISRAMGFDIVPETIIREGPTIEEIKMGYQAGIEAVQAGKGDDELNRIQENHFGIGSWQRWDEKGTPVGMVQTGKNGAEQESWDEMMALDIVIANSDRHMNNYLINESTKKVIAIDNNLSFSHDFYYMTHAESKSGNQPISPKIHAALERYVSREKDIMAMAQKIGSPPELIRHVENSFTRAKILNTMDKFPGNPGLWDTKAREIIDKSNNKFVMKYE